MAAEKIARRRRRRRRRIGMAIGAVAAVLVVDALAALSLTRRSPGKAAITVAGDPQRIQRSWLDMHGGDGIGTVRFLPAPGGRGTEIHVDAKSGVERVKAELRRFKQLLETGEEVRS